MTTTTKTKKAATAKRKKKEDAPKQKKLVTLIARELTPAAPKHEAEPTSETRAPKPKRQSKRTIVNLQNKALLSIIKRENPPFIFNEVEVSKGKTKLLGHYKIQGYPRKNKPMTNDELRDLEKWERRNYPEIEDDDEL